MPNPASAATGKTPNAQALLEEAKANALQRKLAAKQTELDRFDEDLKKARVQSEGLQQSLDNVTAATAESNDHLAQLAAQKKRLTEMLEIVTLRSEAERAKMEGLKMLGIAQKKSLDAIAKGNEETELKAIIGKAEINLLSPKDLPVIGASNAHDSGRSRPESTTEMRKKLGKVSSSTVTANISAREAMITASAKLQQADAAGAKATRRATELGITEIPTLPPSSNEEIDLSGAAPQVQPASEKKRSKR